MNPSQVVFTLGCLLSCVVCGSLRHLLSLPVDLPFPSSWWPPQSSQRSSTQAVLLSLWWEEVKSSGWLTQVTELCLLLRHCVGGNHCLFKEFAAPERPDSRLSHGLLLSVEVCFSPHRRHLHPSASCDSEKWAFPTRLDCTQCSGYQFEDVHEHNSLIEHLRSRPVQRSMPHDVHIVPVSMIAHVYIVDQFSLLLVKKHHTIPRFLLILLFKNK